MSLDRVKAAVDRGRQAQLEPPPEGEVREWQSVEESFGDDDWTELHRVVREIARRAPGTFARFFGDVRLGRWVVDILTDESGIPTIDWLIGEIERRATDEGPWLVATPLAHVEAGALYTELSSTAALVQVEQRQDVGDEEPVSTTMEQWRHLRDHLAPASRWLHGSPRLTPFPIDTGCRSALITVEHGTEGVAMNRARSRGLLAMAVWTLFETPGWRRVWPSVADWAPQPWIELSGRHKPFEPDVWLGATRRTRHRGPITARTRPTRSARSVTNQPCRAPSSRSRSSTSIADPCSGRCAKQFADCSCRLTSTTGATSGSSRAFRRDPYARDACGAQRHVDRCASCPQDTWSQLCRV